MNPNRRFLRPSGVYLCKASFAFLTTAGLIGCGGAEKEKEPTVSVQVTPVARATITETVDAEAVVFPLQQAVLMPKITSTIKKFYVQRGARVHKGELLAVLENSDLSAGAEQSKGELEQAEAGFATTTNASLPQEIQKAELDMVAAKSAYEAQRTVYESRKELFDQGALPRRDLDSAHVGLVQAKSQYDVTERQFEDLKRIGEKEALKSATGQLTAARGKYRTASAQLSYSEIRSPMNGVITDRPQYEGELATANQPLLTVMDMSKLIAKAHISQADVAVLKAKNEAEIHVPGSDDAVKGRITLISPALDPGSTTTEVWVEADKPGSALKPGLTVKLSLAGRSAKDALVVPTGAIYRNDESTSYVVLAGKDNHAHIVPIETGIRNHEVTQVTKGVKEGDSVITTGGYALPDNTQIKVEAAEKSDAKTPAGEAQGETE